MENKSRKGYEFENYVKKIMEDEFETTFEKQELEVGDKGNKKEFDLVSENKEIVIMVKSSSPKETGKKRYTFLKRCAYDLFLLEKVNAKKKILVLNDEEVLEQFKGYFNGIIPDDIEVRLKNKKISEYCF